MSQYIAGVSWEQQKDTIQKQWNLITDEDVLTLDSTLDGLSEILRHRYGFSVTEAEVQIQIWLASFNP